MADDQHKVGYILLSSPQNNGHHQCVRRTFKAETSKPPSATARVKPIRFGRFRRQYNNGRPQEALGQTKSAKHCCPTARRLRTGLQKPWCDADYKTRTLRVNGEIKLHGKDVFINEVLLDHTVGLVEQERGNLVRFCQRYLGMSATGFSWSTHDTVHTLELIGRSGVIPITVVEL